MRVNRSSSLYLFLTQLLLSPHMRVPSIPLEIILFLLRLMESVESCLLCIFHGSLSFILALDCFKAACVQQLYTPPQNYWPISKLPFIIISNDWNAASPPVFFFLPRNQIYKRCSLCQITTNHLACRILQLWKHGWNYFGQVFFWLQATLATTSITLNYGKCRCQVLIRRENV